MNDGKYALWIRSLNSPALRQLPGTEGAILPFWSPDGRQIGFLADRQLKRVDLVGGAPQTVAEIDNNFGAATWSSKGTILFGNDGALYSEPAQGGERKVVRAPGQGEFTPRAPELLLESQEEKNIEQWSPDGKYPVYNVNSKPGSPQDLYVLPLFGDREPIAVLTSPFIEDMGQISPNGKWLAYRSNESGTCEVYALAFAPNDPAARRKWRISTGGGMEPQWRADGKELFYLNGSTLMSVEVKGDGREFEAGLPKVVFDAILTPTITRNRYAVSRDGQRFLMITMPNDEVHPEIHVVVNWEAGVRR